MHIGAYRAQQQGYGPPLQLFMSRKVRKREKHMEKTLPQERKRKKLNKMYSTYIFIHLNKLSELLMIEEFDE